MKNHRNNTFSMPNCILPLDKFYWIALAGLLRCAPDNSCLSLPAPVNSAGGSSAPDHSFLGSTAPDNSARGLSAPDDSASRFRNSTTVEHHPPVDSSNLGILLGIIISYTTHILWNDFQTLSPPPHFNAVSLYYSGCTAVATYLNFTCLGLLK